MKAFIRICLCVCLLCLCGCTKKYTDDDVNDFIREKLNIADFEILSGPEDVKGEDGYTDQMWTVSTDVFGLDEALVFHVYNDYFYGMEWVQNNLESDLYYQKQLILLEGFQVPDGITIETHMDGSGRPIWLYALCPISGRADFEQGPLFAEAWQAHVQAYPTVNDVEMSLDYQVKETGFLPDQMITDRRYTVDIAADTDRKEIDAAVQKASDDYLMDCISYGLLPRMEEYSLSERSRVIQENQSNTEIFRIGEEEPAYPGYAYYHSTSIPCGTLYMILSMEGYEPSGDWTSFSFAGDDGQIYTCDYAVDPGMDVETVNAATHLNLDDHSAILEVIIDEKVLELLDTDAQSLAQQIRDMGDNVCRSLEVSGNTIHMTGKPRQFGRIVKANEQRLKELSSQLASYGSFYGLVYNNMSKVYQGIGFRMANNVPQDTGEKIIREAAGLAAYCQILSSGTVYDWSLEVTFSVPEQGEIREVLKLSLPQDTLDIKEIYKALK